MTGPDGIYEGSKFPEIYKRVHLLVGELINTLRDEGLMREFYHCEIGLEDESGLVKSILIRKHEEGDEREIK